MLFLTMQDSADFAGKVPERRISCYGQYLNTTSNLSTFWQLFGFIERYGASGALKTRKEDQKISGLQNFLQTLNKRQEKEGGLRY